MSLKLKTLTTAEIATLAGSNGLLDGELIFLSDTSTTVVATSTSTYESITGGGTGLAVGDLITTSSFSVADALPARGWRVEKGRWPQLYDIFGDRYWPHARTGWTAGNGASHVPSGFFDTMRINEIAYSNDGRRLFVNRITRQTVYDMTGPTQPEIQLPGVDNNNFSGGCWSPTGRYLVVTGTGSPPIQIYDWESGQPVLTAEPSTQPSGQARGAEWSPNGRYLAVGGNLTPYINFYDWSSGSAVKMSNPATLPLNSVTPVAWSPNSRYCACGQSTGSPWMDIYDFNTGSPVRLANPATLPTGIVGDLKFSPNGRYLAVAHSTSPYITIYDFGVTGVSAPTKITDPSSLPTGNATDVCWSPDGRYMAVVHVTTPFITIYDWATGSPIKVSNPSILPPTTPSVCAWSPDGGVLLVGHSTFGTTPYLTAYFNGLVAESTDFYLPDVPDANGVKTFVHVGDDFFGTFSMTADEVEAEVGIFGTGFVSGNFGSGSGQLVTGRATSGLFLFEDRITSPGDYLYQLEIEGDVRGLIAGKYLKIVNTLTLAVTSFPIVDNEALIYYDPTEGAPKGTTNYSYLQTGGTPAFVDGGSYTATIVESV